MPRFPLARNLVVYAIFAASGASALIYQVLWSRWLSLSFGSTTASVSIVLACFMMGLALGSAAAGRLMRRITNPLRVYAAMEFGIAVFAVFFPLLLSFTDSIFPLIVSPSSSVFYSLTMRALLALLLLIAPTSMMGATLPLLAEFFRRNPRQTTSFKVGVLYAANTLGAALGILASSFFLIELVGVFTTTMIAASLNLFVAAMGYHYSRSAAKMPPPSKEAGRAIANEPAFMVKLATAVLAASGAVAMASEVLWTRALETVMGNSAYAFATIVCVYLVGIALGSWLMAMVVHRLRRQYPFWLAALQLTMGAWLLISIVIIQKISEALLQHNAQMAAITSHLLVYLQVTLVLMPLSLASGACFPLAARMIEPDAEDPKGESIGRAYSWNTVGGVIGSLLAGFLIAPHFDSFDALYLIALAYGIIALMVLTTTAWRERPARRDRAAWGSMSALILLVIASALYSTTNSGEGFSGLRAKWRMK